MTKKEILLENNEMLKLICKSLGFTPSTRADQPNPNHEEKR
jgi:hypothetical protein